MSCLTSTTPMGKHGKIILHLRQHTPAQKHTMSCFCPISMSFSNQGLSRNRSSMGFHTGKHSVTNMATNQEPVPAQIRVCSDMKATRWNLFQMLAVRAPPEQELKCVKTIHRSLLSVHSQSAYQCQSPLQMPDTLLWLKRI